MAVSMAPPAPIIVPTGRTGRLPRAIQSLVAWGTCAICVFGKVAVPVCLVLLSLVLQGCSPPPAHEPVTLTVLDQDWTTKTFTEERQDELRQFTRQTGIQVKLLPSPEAAREQLIFWRELLRTRTSEPDVYGLDVIWPGMLGEYFIDLKPYFANEIPAHFHAI